MAGAGGLGKYRRSVDRLAPRRLPCRAALTEFARARRGHRLLRMLQIRKSAPQSPSARLVSSVRLRGRESLANSVRKLARRMPARATDPGVWPITVRSRRVLNPCADEGRQSQDRDHWRSDEHRAPGNPREIDDGARRGLLPQLAMPAYFDGGAIQRLPVDSHLELIGERAGWPNRQVGLRTLEIDHDRELTFDVFVQPPRVRPGNRGRQCRVARQSAQ